MVEGPWPNLRTTAHLDVELARRRPRGYRPPIPENIAFPRGPPEYDVQKAAKAVTVLEGPVSFLLSSSDCTPIYCTPIYVSLEILSSHAFLLEV